MDAGGAAKAFDAGTGKNSPRSAPLLRVVTNAPAAPIETAKPVDEALGRFGAARRINWSAIGAIAGLHAALLVGLMTMDVVSLSLPLAEPMMVSLVPAAPPPPPPEPAFEPPLEIATPVIVPPALEIVPPRPSLIQAVVAETPPPISTPVTATPSPAPATQGSSAAVTDLSTSMISAAPPKYPVESRRRKEEGTVTLMVTVSPQGDVADIQVSRSSGFSRLDKAALAAVKRWRWSPTLRNGVAVPVRGIVEIPFVLKKS